MGDWTDGTDDHDTTTPEPRREPRKPKPRPDFPLWFRMVVVGAVVAFLGFNVYRGGDVATSVMLGGIVGAALGISEWIGGKPK